MTRRIALAILTIAWITLLTAGFSTYFITRAFLLATLDASILARVASLPELERPASLPNFSPSPRDRFVLQFHDGHTLSSPTLPPSDVPAPKILSATTSELPDGSHLRTLSLTAFAKRQSPADPLSPVTVVYSASADHVHSLLARLLVTLAAFGLVAALATAAAARAVASSALRPLRTAADTLSNIDQHSLHQRIDVPRLPPELAPVASRLNDMLARLETSFAQRKQFLADASHELRTPVAALVTTLEVALRRPRDAADYRRTLDACLAEAQLLHHLVIALLDQVRAERFETQPDLAPTPLHTLLAECAARAQTLASLKHISIASTPLPPTLLLSDEFRLRSMLTNLLSNAVEYTQPHGHISLSASLLPPDPALPLPPALAAALPEGLHAQPARLRLAVRDDGPGIPPQHLPNLFEPFYRADLARSPSHHHLGLGLSSVQSNARSLGGTCAVTSPPAPNLPGSEFTIHLPTVLLPSVPDRESADFLLKESV